jgi:long-subunit fatty acid transport protein
MELSLSYQLEGDGDNQATTSLGAEYAIRENLAFGVSCDLADSEDSVCFELNGSHALSEPWALTGGVSYTDYSVAEDTDYDELELAAGFEYQVSEAWLTSLRYVWTDPSNEDINDKWVLGAEYTYADYGIYCEYEIPDEGYTVKLGVKYQF